MQPPQLYHKLMVYSLHKLESFLSKARNQDDTFSVKSIWMDMSVHSTMDTEAQNSKSYGQSS